MLAGETFGNSGQRRRSRKAPASHPVQRMFEVDLRAVDEHAVHLHLGMAPIRSPLSITPKPNSRRIDKNKGEVKGSLPGAAASLAVSEGIYMFGNFSLVPDRRALELRLPVVRVSFSGLQRETKEPSHLTLDVPPFWGQPHLSHDQNLVQKWLAQNRIKN